MTYGADEGILQMVFLSGSLSTYYKVISSMNSESEVALKIMGNLLGGINTNIAKEVVNTSLLDILMDYYFECENQNVNQVFWICSNFAASGLKFSQKLTSHKLFKCIIDSLVQNYASSVTSEAIWTISNSLHKQPRDEILKILINYKNIIEKLLF